MRLVKSLDEIGVIPLQVSGNLVRISMTQKRRRKRELTAEFYPVCSWIKKNCPSSSVISDYFTYDLVENKPVLLIDFSDHDLEKFRTHWEHDDGTLHWPEIECRLLRRSDYVDTVRRIVRERWGIQELPKIGSRTNNRWDFELSDDDNRQRWYDMYRLRHVEGQVTQWEMLDDEARSKLLRFNNQLRDMERWAFVETMAIRGRAPDLQEPGKFKRQKVDDYPFSGDFFRLDDVKINFAFAMGELDPRYDDDDDNYLYRFQRSVFGLTFDSRDQWETGLVKPDWQKDRIQYDTEPKQRCFLFNYLIRCAGLDLADLLCIENIFFDLIFTGSHVSAPLTDPDDIRPRYAPAKRPWNDELRYKDRIREVYAKTFEERMAPQLQFDDLSDADQQHCQRINAELSQIEHQTQQIGAALTKLLNTRVADENDLLDDFELELYVSHILHPGDEMSVRPRYNLLLRQLGYGAVPPKNEREPQQDLEYDWNIPSSLSCFGFPHCWLFHDLYDHSDISWADLPRIDRIHASLEIQLQRWVAVSS